MIVTKYLIIDDPSVWIVLKGVNVAILLSEILKGIFEFIFKSLKSTFIEYF